MYKSSFASLLFGLAISTSGLAHATTIAPYPDAGAPNLDTYTFTALSTGHVTGFFAGASAADTSEIGLSVNGATPVVFGLSNQSSAISQSLDFGSVSAGDLLTFRLNNLTAGTQLSSDATFNPDGLQHVFGRSFLSSGDAIPSGLQISFEDLAKSQGGDFDYNDASFVFTNVTDDAPGVDGPAAAPLPAALSMFLGGVGVIVLVAGRGRRKKRRGRLNQKVPLGG